MAATQLSNEQVAYLAGLIDGDGCISLYKRKDAKAARGTTYTPYMTITAKNISFLEYLKEMYGGSINLATAKSGFNGLGCKSLRFSSNECRYLLPLLIPHLVLKKSEAYILLGALQITQNHRQRVANSDIALDTMVMNMKHLKKNRLVEVV